MMVISTLLIAAGGYIINDYYDQKIDMINRPKEVVVGTKLRRRLAIASHFLLSIVGITLGFFVKLEIGIIHMLSSFFLWYYSNSLRRIPVIGNLVIAVMAGLALIIVPVYLGRNEPMVFAYAVFAATIILIREVIKDMEDVKGDSTFGAQSIPVVWGIRGAKTFIYIVIAAGTIALISFLFLVKSWNVRYYFMALSPFFLWFCYRLALADKQRDYGWLIGFTNLIIFTGLISMLII